MSNLTTNYSFTKPLGTDNIKIDDINNNFDLADTTLKTIDTKVTNNTSAIATNTANITNNANAIALNTSALANIPQQDYITQKANYREQAYRNFNFIKNNGVDVVIGDSISAGHGIALYSDMYVTKLQAFFNAMSGYNDFETITNFSQESNYNIGINGSTSIGVLGASKKSLIMQPNATITFTGNIQYVDFLYHQTPTSGKLEVRCNGNLYKTLDCSGADTLDKSSFPTTSSNNGTSVVYTITCISASVEITGLIRLVNKNKYGNANVIRCTVSGVDTTYFADNAVLASIKATANTFVSGITSNKCYLIALGTNDIYNPTLAKSSIAFNIELEIIIKALLNDTNDARVILTVPPLADESIWPIIIEPHMNYRNVIYALANKYNLSVIDYTYIDFIINNWYQDGVHPNPTGNEQMFEHILKTLSINIGKTPKTPYVRLETFAVQSIIDSAFTSVNFATAINDTDGIFKLTSPTRITCNTPGFYSLFGMIDFAPNSTGARAIVFKKNTTTYYGQNYISSPTGIDTAITNTTAIYLNIGDYIELQVYQTSGASINLTSASFGMFKVG